jgi:hypothetical protein
MSEATGMEDRPMAPPGFQTAGTVHKSTTTTPGSLRNASGGQPPIPKEPAPAPVNTPISSSSETASKEPPVPPAKIKPINRPIASKNAIVYNAVQVSPLFGIGVGWADGVLETKSCTWSYQECGY